MGSGAIKRHGVIACDSCGRDFSSRDNDWNCPRCGFDNAVAMRIRGDHAARCAAKASAEASKQRAKERHNATGEAKRDGKEA